MVRQRVAGRQRDRRREHTASLSTGHDRIWPRTRPRIGHSPAALAHAPKKSLLPPLTERTDSRRPCRHICPQLIMYLSRGAQSTVARAFDGQWWLLDTTYAGGGRAHGKHRAISRRPRHPHRSPSSIVRTALLPPPPLLFADDTKRHEGNAARPHSWVWSRNLHVQSGRFRG